MKILKYVCCLLFLSATIIKCEEIPKWKIRLLSTKNGDTSNKSGNNAQGMNKDGPDRALEIQKILDHSSSEYHSTNEGSNSRKDQVVSVLGRGLATATSQFLKGMAVAVVFFFGLNLLVKGLDEESTSEPFASANSSQALINPKALSSLNKYERELLPGLVDGQRLGINFEDIGGLKDVKASIISALKDPLDYPELYRGQSELLRPPKGVLLYGPPGCGKTMLAKAIARECKANFLMITPSSILRKYVGESNLLTRALFSLARKIQPCIIFIDEVDGLFGKRAAAGSGVNEALRDVKTEFMQLWEGLGSEADSFVVVLGATNQPWELDPAFHRRFGRAFHVGMPSPAQREECIRILLKDVKTEKNFGYRELAELLEGYSPADIKELCRVASQSVVQEAQAKLQRRQQKYKAYLQAAKDETPTGKEMKAPTIDKIELRPLRSNDILRAQKKVLPTNWQSAAYKSLVDKSYNEQDWWRN